MSGLGPAPIGPGALLPVGDDPATPVVVDVAPPRATARSLPGVAGPARRLVRRRRHRNSSTAGEWTVETVSRVGVRLAGVALRRLDAEELASEGLVAGAIQVPPDGQPVVMLADHPTTGGYPVIAVVDPDDLAALAQRRVGSTVRFGHAQ